jgi:hypothetical protein
LFEWTKHDLALIDNRVIVEEVHPPPFTNSFSKCK